MRFSFFQLLSATLLVGNSVLLRAQDVANFVSLTPCRVVDTREEARGSLGTPVLAANAQRDLPILQSSCGIPTNALAYAFNITVIPHGSLPYLTVWPTGRAQPGVSTLNSYQGTVVANAALVPAGTNGSISVYAAGTTDLIIDITGYFAQQSTVAVDQVNQQVGQINQQITQVNQQIAQQGSQLTQQISQVNQQGSQLAQQISQLSQQTALVSQHTTQIGQINQQMTQVNQQISPLAQQMSQLNQQAALVSQQATQVGQQAAQINQQVTQVNQVLTDVHSDAASQGTALGSGTFVSGSQNTATGYNALRANSNGNGNTAIGSGALLASITGSNNVGLGAGALSSTLSGDSNIAIGYGAGSSVGNTSNSIEIGHVGQPNDDGVIRIGTPGTHQSAFMAGITGVTVGGVGQAVMVDENGQLGTLQSSARYKEDIQDIGGVSDALMNLRPVRFRYKRTNGKGERPTQYGLIAEEVAEVFPELVIYNQQGEIQTVQYHQLPALLLNELQKQHRVIDQQQQELQRESEERRGLLARIVALESQVSKQR
jgi:predicted  nucleic acid-binding Zn-ribbon protein